MDPNAALEQLRAKMVEIRDGIDNVDSRDIITAASEAVDLWEGLDQWITRGGFLPIVWTGDVEVSITRLMIRKDVCICEQREAGTLRNCYPHKKGIGCP